MQSLLRTVLHQHATRLAVQAPSVSWTYGELGQLSNALAQALIARGVQPGQMLPLLMARSALLVLTELAIIRIGAGYSPLDMASPVKRRESMLDAIDSPLLLSDGGDSAMASARPEKVFNVAAWLREHRALGATVLAESRNAAEVWIAPPENASVYVMFTSGSTGKPKGVMVPHAGIVRLVEDGSCGHFGPEQRWAFMTSAAFDPSNLEVWGALLNGGCCVVQEVMSPSLDQLGEFLVEQHISAACLTAALFNAMVEDQLPALGALRQLLVGGERVSRPHARRMLLAHPHVRLTNGYGPTEATTLTTWHSIDLKDTESEEGVPIGKAVFRTELRIEPTDASCPTQGELWIGGDGLALGYLGDAESTARQFVWHDGMRWYRSGDLVSRRADGLYMFLGRVDRQIKLRGHRIELEEVELALTRCPGIGNGAVLVLGDSADERRIVAVYNLLDADGPSEAKLIAHMQSILPPAAVPAEFVCLAQLPVNLSGKLDRKALEAMWVGGRRVVAARPGASLLERLLQALRSDPDHAAVEGAYETLSYAELDRRSALLGSRFIAQGIRPGDHVALFLHRSPELVVAVLACVRIGAVYAPIDLESPPERVTRMLSVLKPRLIFGDATLDAARRVMSAPTCPWLDAVAIDWSAPFEAPRPDLGGSPNLPICIFFTSGSTGSPKAVLVPAAGIERLVRDGHPIRFGPQQRWGFLSSPAFDASTLEMWGPLLNGATCVVQEESTPTLERLGQFLLQRHVTDAWLTAGLFNAMVDDQCGALGTLQQLLVGGERLSAQHARQMLQAHPATRLINGYGPTENTTFTLCHTVTLADVDAPTGIPIGSPIADTLVCIDPSLATGPDAVMEGELWAGGAGVALGYLDDAELTSRKFVLHDGARWYRTGDLVRQRADGGFDFLGRVDRQVKLQGHRVELDEVELALTSCPGIAQAAVIVRGEVAANRHLAACFCSVSGAPPDTETVVSHLNGLLPPAAMPKIFRALPRLPLGLTGKVDRAALAQLLDADEQAQVQVAADHANEFDAAELALAAIWQELLPRASLHPDSNFLRVGGTSLLALHVAALVRDRMQRQVSPVDVLRYPVLSQQAHLFAHAAPTETHAGAAGGLEGPEGARWADPQIPLTRAQQNLLAATRLDPSACAYLVHVALHVPALPDPGAWRAAFDELARRHPALRLVADHDGLHARAGLLEDLAHGWWQQQAPLAHAPGDLAWPAELLAVVNRPLDTATQGSMRVDHFPLPGGSALLVWTLHHYVVDETSVATALTELDGLLLKRILPPVYGSPFVFPAVEAAGTDTAGVAAYAAHILKTLAGQKLPLARAPALGHEARMDFDQGRQQPLDNFCRVVGCTPFSVLLTAYGLALQDAFGASFGFVTTPFSRRSEPELLEPIGLLLDLRVIEAGALPAETSGQTLARVARLTRAAQDPTFESVEDLMRAVALKDSVAAECLTQFGFTWRLDPTRSVEIAGQSVQLMRVPHVGARFSICLHVAQLGSAIGCSIEAVESAWTNGSVDLVWAAFVRRLEMLCTEARAVLEAESLHPDAVRARIAASAGASSESGAFGEVAVAVAPNPLDDDLRRAWSRWVTAANRNVTADSHFLRSGSSSLAAMRMVAELRRDHGVKLEVSAFLANPTFARLSALSQARLPVPVDKYVLLGPADYTQVIVLIPGSGGQVAGMYAMAEELLRRLAAGTAVVIIDLDAILQSAPESDPLWFVTRRIVQIVRDLGVARVLKIVGFSLGGTLALRVCAELGTGAALPVCLLDTFAPRTMRRGFWRRMEINLAWKIFGGRPMSVVGSTATSGALEESLQFRASDEQWVRFRSQLEQGSFAAPDTPVHLIQAEHSVKYVGLLWQRRNNGFVPSDYASWTVHKIDGAHLDIPRHLAASTAGIILEHGTGASGLAGPVKPVVAPATA